MARRCCSNCEVWAPSIVQWPLLWTRGAISLTIGAVGAGEELDGQHADMVERLGDRFGRSDRLARPWPRSPDRRERSKCAGCRPHDGCGSAGRRVVSPRRLRARMTLNSASKVIAASATAGWRPIASQAAAASSADGPRPGPCRHSRSGGSSAGSASRAHPARRRYRRACRSRATARPGRRNVRGSASRGPVLRHFEAARAGLQLVAEHRKRRRPGHSRTRR